MKRMLLPISIPIFIAALLVVFSGLAAAKVSGRCDSCHTMHNSQGNSEMATGEFPPGDGPPHPTLLMNSCVGCHSNESSSTTFTLGGCVVPVVNYTGAGEPTEYLAGGNFYWVAQSGGDAKGHNVLGIAGADLELGQAPGNPNQCANSCHYSLATTDYNAPGCQGCHLKPAHHANDHANGVSGLVTSADQGWYRFLSGHMSGELDGVEGYEHGEWEKGHPNLANGQADNHNSYLGDEGDHENHAGFYNLGHTTTAFCCGCHGVFHKEKDTGSNWIRHPSDAVIPDSGEYAEYTVYDPLSPVGRPDLAAGWTPQAEVRPGTDMVMCLSCHRPHGSPYNDLLRWDYGLMIAGGGDLNRGCFACHTAKDTGG